MYRFVLIIVFLVGQETMAAFLPFRPFFNSLSHPRRGLMLSDHRPSWNFHRPGWNPHKSGLNSVGPSGNWYKPIWNTVGPSSALVGLTENTDRPTENVAPSENLNKPTWDCVNPSLDSIECFLVGPGLPYVGPTLDQVGPSLISARPNLDTNNVPDLDPFSGEDIVPDISNDIEYDEAGCTSSVFPPAANSLCCGVDATSFLDYTHARILGGNTTNIELYPWLVRIEYLNRNTDTMEGKCGGVLISGRYVLSAAHCFTGVAVVEYIPLNVILGEYDANNEGPDCVEAQRGTSCTDGAIRVPIKRYRTHAEYVLEVNSLNQTVRNLNDIAIVMLNRNVEYTRFIRPICLPTSDVIAFATPNLRFTTAGWGATSVWREQSGTEVVVMSSSDEIKRHVDVPLVKTLECAVRYEFITKNHICAGGEAGKDSCVGDSGGPLMTKTDGVYEVVGLVSAGPRFCGSPGIPAVYTNVYQYLDWIREQILTFNVSLLDSNSGSDFDSVSDSDSGSDSDPVSDLC